MMDAVRHAFWYRASLALALVCSATGGSRADDPAPAFDLSEEKVLYCVGYAHLDTQWRWDFAKTIDQYLLDTLDQNFSRFENYAGYVFNFTGSVRYEMMKEYYPARYERLKAYIASGHWFVSGSSVDEGDLNVVAPESVIRQVLYGNGYFRSEFGRESVDFMLPDCFGFPATLPSLLAHCGLKGFSTQKLTWGSAVGIPFSIGVWEGPDGNSIVAALDPGSYASGLDERVDTNPQWVERVNANGRRFGVWADYHYYGVGDMGGAPREKHVRNYLASVDNPDSEIRVALTSSDQFYNDLTAEQRGRLPRYKGDLLLTEHSAGTLTSQSYMKRWNRRNEILADAAERAAVAADWFGGATYPHERLRQAWVRTLANQMHDILPGTSIPRAYTYSWNDEVVAANGFEAVLCDAAGALTRGLDTNVAGRPLVVYNPLATAREDVVVATIAPLDDAAAVRVFDPAGKEVAAQILERDDDTWKIAFLAATAPLSWSVYDVRPADTASASSGALRIDRSGLENEIYRVKLDAAGDVASVIDKRSGRELLREPARLEFTYERPRSYPAWNMDWADRQRPVLGVVDGPPTIRIVENGPVRVALEVRRAARGSVFIQHLRLAAGAAGERLEFATEIDWQTTGCALRQSFPLTISNPEATYNWGAGTVRRGNNEPTRYENPAHEWFDLSNPSGDYGVTVLDDSKFGSDKPADDHVRLTLLYTPAVRDSYLDQHSQDWGRHEIVYGLYGHQRDWRAADSFWQARRLNQPLRVFAADRHAGPLGRTWSFGSTNSRQVRLHALKQSEDGDWVIIRLQELWGRDADNVRVSFAAPLAAAHEVDGQERRIGKADLADGGLAVRMAPYAIRTFAVRLADAPTRIAAPHSTPVTLDFDSDIVSRDEDRADGGLDTDGRTLPGEMLPRELVDGDLRFKLGPTTAGAANAVACRGQTIALPEEEFDRVHVLAIGRRDTTATFRVGDTPVPVAIQAWTGFVGQWDNRIWDRPMPEVDFRGEGHVVGIAPGYIKPGRIAWYSTHRHAPEGGNEAYQFSYLFQHVLDAPPNARTLTLPDDPDVFVCAVSVSRNANIARPGAALFEDFADRRPIDLRYEYPPPPVPVYRDLEPVGRTEIDRRGSFDALTIGPPRDDDYASRQADLAFRFDRQAATPHVGAGRDGTRLAALNDGLLPRNHDDPPRCIWFDGPGWMYTDLGAALRIDAVRTYSCHRSDRAPQHFSLWGATGDQRPPVEFAHGEHGRWTLLGVVDSRERGEGDVHGSQVRGPGDDPLGRYRYLLWVLEPQRQGTFFTEIDIDAAR